MFVNSHVVCVFVFLRSCIGLFVGSFALLVLEASADEARWFRENLGDFEREGPGSQVRESARVCVCM